MIWASHFVLVIISDKIHNPTKRISTLYLSSGLVRLPIIFARGKLKLLPLLNNLWLDVNKKKEKEGERGRKREKEGERVPVPRFHYLVPQAVIAEPNTGQKPHLGNLFNSEVLEDWKNPMKWDRPFWRKQVLGDLRALRLFLGRRFRLLSDAASRHERSSWTSAWPFCFTRWDSLLGSQVELQPVHVLDDRVPSLNFAELPRVYREAVLLEEVVKVRGAVQQPAII